MGKIKPIGNDEVRRELQELAPALFALQKTNPFLVPENYFDELQKNAAPQASASASPMPTENPFKVPLGYFDELPDRIRARTDAVGESDQKLRRIPFQFKVVAVAASLVGIILMIVPMIDKSSADTQGISRQEVSEYMLANVDVFTDTEIAQFIGDETLSAIASQETMLNETELNNYLLDEVDLLKDEWL